MSDRHGWLKTFRQWTSKGCRREFFVCWCCCVLAHGKRLLVTRYDKKLKVNEDLNTFEMMVERKRWGKEAEAYAEAI